MFYHKHWKQIRLLHIDVLGDATHPVNESGLDHGGHELHVALVASWRDPIEGDARQRAALGGLQVGKGVVLGGALQGL